MSERETHTEAERETERKAERQTETRTDRQRDLYLPWLLATALMSEFVRLERTLFREHTPGSSSISITVEVWPAQLRLLCVVSVSHSGSLVSRQFTHSPSFTSVTNKQTNKAQNIFQLNKAINRFSALSKLTQTWPWERVLFALQPRPHNCHVQHWPM